MPLHTHSESPLPTEVTALIARIPLFEGHHEINVEPLDSVISLNNSTYRITSGDSTYMLRVAADTAHLLGIRREDEVEAVRAASAIGIAPPLLYVDPAGHMLMEWIDGNHWEPEEFHTEQNIQRLAETLKRLHQVKSVNADASVYRRIERLIASARELKLQMPHHLDECLSRMREIETHRLASPSYSPGLVHNDFWANNFVDDTEQLWVLDWEFGGNGDGFYDLATTSFAGNYTPDEEIQLLEAYGCDHLEDLKTLEAMKFVVMLFEACWAMVMYGVRPDHHFDYHKAAQKMFNRLAEAIASPLKLHP